MRELALINLAIDSKFRGCDLVRLCVNDIAQSGRVLSGASIAQRKTHRPVQFEITKQTRHNDVWKAFDASYETDSNLPTD